MSDDFADGGFDGDLDQDGGEPGAEISIAFDFGSDEPRSGEWPEWEQSRSRSFFAADPTPIDEKGLLGTLANKTLELACKRTAAGFEATWRLSFEERITPNRIRRGEPTGYLLAGTSRLLSFRVPQFARACGTRTHQWSGSMTREQFEQVTGFQIFGDVEIRRC